MIKFIDEINMSSLGKEIDAATLTHIMCDTYKKENHSLAKFCVIFNIFLKHIQCPYNSHAVSTLNLFYYSGFQLNLKYEFKRRTVRWLKKLHPKPIESQILFRGIYGWHSSANVEIHNRRWSYTDVSASLETVWGLIFKNKVGGVRTNEPDIARNRSFVLPNYHFKKFIQLMFWEYHFRHPPTFTKKTVSGDMHIGFKHLCLRYFNFLFAHSN